jgi:hypothetical protein
VEICYAGGDRDTVPLVVGYTLDGRYKRFRATPALRLHPTADPFQHYFVVSCRDAAIEKIRFVPRAEAAGLPQFTAITCETAAGADTLEPLPDLRPAADEQAWIAARAISADNLKLDAIRAEIRSSQSLAPAAARSE